MSCCLEEGSNSHHQLMTVQAQIPVRPNPEITHLNVEGQKDLNGEQCLYPSGDEGGSEAREAASGKLELEQLLSETV